MEENQIIGDPLQDLYNEFNSKLKLAKDYNEFKSIMQDPSNRKAFFDEFNPKLKLAKDYNEFDSVLGLKKKELSLPSGEVSSLSELPSEFIAPLKKGIEPPKPSKEVVSSELIVPTNLPKQDVRRYENELKVNDAALNTLTDIYKQKGLKFDPSKPAAQKQIQEYIDKEKNNDLVRVTGKDGKEYLTRGQGFGEATIKTLGRSLKDPIESAQINFTNNPSELADLLDEKMAQEPNVPESAPTKFGGYLGGLVGGLPKMGALLAIPYAGESAMVMEMYHNAMANQRRELYQSGLEQGMTREQAAKKAMETAPVTAIPDAVLGYAMAKGVGTGGMKAAEQVGKNILPEAAKKSFVDAAGKLTKEVGVMSGLGFGGEVGRGLLTKQAGYNITNDEILQKGLSGASEWGLMHAAFKLMHVAPKAISAAAKNLLSSVPEPILKAEAENYPDGEQTLQDVAKFANTKAKVADFVPESKVAAVTGLTEKTDNLKKDIEALEQNKKAVPPSVAVEIDNQIKDKNKEVDFYDNQIKKVINSKGETGIDEEVDDITGKKLGTKTYVVDGKEVSQAEFEAMQNKPVGTKEIIKPTEIDETANALKSFDKIIKGTKTVGTEVYHKAVDLINEKNTHKFTGKGWEDVAEAYHKALKSGKNPELVELIDKTLSKEVKPTEVKALEEEYNNKSVDELIALKKKLYPSPDIESQMTPEEKLLDRVIAKKFSEKQQEIISKRKAAAAEKAPKTEKAEEVVVEEKVEITKDDLKKAEAKFAAARDRFEKAKAKVEATQVKQAGLFGGEQKGMFAMGGEEAKSTLDPLRKATKEAKAELDDIRNRIKVQEEAQPELAPIESDEEFVNDKIKLIKKEGKPLSEFKVGDKVVWASDWNKKWKQLSEGKIIKTGNEYEIERFSDNPMFKRFKTFRLNSGDKVIMKPSGEANYIGEENIEKKYKDVLKEKQEEEKKRNREIGIEKATKTKEIFRKLSQTDRQLGTGEVGAQEIAMRYLADGGIVSEDAINEAYGTVKRAELNTGRKEVKTAEVRARDYAGGKETLNDLAHRLWEANDQRVPEDLIKDALMAEIGNSTTRLDAAEAYLDNYNEEYKAEKYYARIAEEHEAIHLAAQEELEKELKGELDKQIEGLSSEEHINNLIDQYETETKGENKQLGTEGEGEVNKEISGRNGGEKTKVEEKGIEDVTRIEKRKIINSKFEELLNNEDFYNKFKIKSKCL